MNRNSSEQTTLFNFSPVLGIPKIFPDIVPGKVPISVQFISPGLNIKKEDEQSIIQIAKKTTINFCGFRMEKVEEKNTKRRDMLFNIAFYIPGEIEEVDSNIVIQNSRLVVERFIGLLSFSFGVRLFVRHIEPTTVNSDGFKKLIMPASGRAQNEIYLELTDLGNVVPDGDTFAALYWLRRGLDERDPVETFSSLMVCLQIMARRLAQGQPQFATCPKCKKRYIVQKTTITSKMRELVNKLGGNPGVFEKLWEARSSIVAHGDKPVTADVLIDLTQLKFEAIKLAYKSIKLELGIPLEGKPHPHSSLFVTDALMYND